MKRKLLKYILDLFGLDEYLDGMTYEIQCNKDYMQHQESVIADMKLLNKNLKSQLIEEKNLNMRLTQENSVNQIDCQISKSLVNIQNGPKDAQIIKLQDDIAILRKALVKQLETRGQFCSDKWISCNHILPSISLPELLVTDGEISSVASFDIHTKQFLRCFGSHTMRVPMPIAWQLIPEAPGKEYSANFIYKPPQVDRRKGLELTYIRD